VAIKDYSSLVYSRIERRALQGWKKWGAVAFLGMLMAASFIPHVGVTLAAFGRGWSLTPLPTEYTLAFFERVSVETPKYIINSFVYCAIAVAICIAVGVPMAWIMARSKLPGRHALDAITTLALAIPGTAIGIAYVRAFNFPLPVFGVALTSLWIVLPLVLAIRRLPYTVRSSFSSLLLVHRSMEEAAESLGANRLQTFRDITLPLVWKGILVCAASLFVMNKIAGTRMGGMFG
jgi:iron(III) transport system permease protein